MPTIVAFAKISLDWISSVILAVSSISYTFTTHSGTAFLIFSAVCSVRSKKASFLLKIVISRAPSNAHCTWIAVAAPPPPATVIFLPLMSIPWSFKLCTNPSPSVMYPVSLPLSFTIVFMAPIIRAAGESSSMYFAASTLSGIVTLHPRMLKVFIAAIASLTLSSFISNATYA